MHRPPQTFPKAAGRSIYSWEGVEAPNRPKVTVRGLGAYRGAEIMRNGHYAIIFTAITIGGSPVRAHHSPAAYDLQAGIELDGIVTRVQWANPHGFVYLETQSEGSESAVWQLEVDAPSNMERHGWYRDSLVTGERVTAQVFPPRNSSKNAGKLFAFVKADGTRLSYMDPALLDVGAPFEVTADGLSGKWAPDSLSPDSRVAVLQEQLIFASFGLDADVPLTEKGIEALQSFTDDISPTVDCIPRTAPSTTMYSSGIHSIEVGDDVVMLRENWFGTERTVYLDVASHEGAPYTIHGHAIGRWEDEVLVVDTARFSEHREGLFNKLPSSRDKHLVERFEPNSDGQSLTYGWELTDPEFLTETVSGENRWTYRPDAEFSIVECSLDSARQFLED